MAYWTVTPAILGLGCRSELPSARNGDYQAVFLAMLRLADPLGEVIIVDRAEFSQEQTMWLIVLLIILVLLFGGGGFYVGPPYHYFGGGLSLILVIVILVILFRG